MPASPLKVLNPHREAIRKKSEDEGKQLHTSLSPAPRLSSKLPALPPELWMCIAELLSRTQLSRLYRLNRVFYDVFLCRTYSTVVFTHSDMLPAFLSKHLRRMDTALLRALHDPQIAGHVQSLRLPSDMDFAFVRAINRENTSSFPRSWLPAFLFKCSSKKEKSIFLTTRSAFVELPKLTALAIALQPAYSQPLMERLGAACSNTVVSLCLIFHKDCSPRLPTTIWPSLRTLTIIIHSVPKVMSKAFPSSFFAAIRGILPQDASCLEELTVKIFCFLSKHASPFPLPSFGPVKKLTLDGFATAIPCVLPYITPHQRTLREITLEKRTGYSSSLLSLTTIDPSFLTSLSIDASPFYIHWEAMRQFLPRCTSLLRLKIMYRLFMGPEILETIWPTLIFSLPRSLEHLEVQSPIANFELFLKIARNLPNISSVILNCVETQDTETQAFFEQKGVPQSSADWVVKFGGLRAPLSALKQALGREHLRDEDLEAVGALFVRCTLSIKKGWSPDIVDQEW